MTNFKHWLEVLSYITEKLLFQIKLFHISLFKVYNIRKSYNITFFITGGKSAVLTGIILALGGKSAATGRYSSLKGFIKTGKK